MNCQEENPFTSCDSHPPSRLSSHFQPVPLMKAAGLFVRRIAGSCFAYLPCRSAPQNSSNSSAPVHLPERKNARQGFKMARFSTWYGRRKTAFSVFWNPCAQTFKLGEQKTPTTEPGHIKSPQRNACQARLYEIFDSLIPRFQPGWLCAVQVQENAYVITIILAALIPLRGLLPSPAGISGPLPGKKARMQPFLALHGGNGKTADTLDSGRRGEA